MTNYCMGCGAPLRPGDNFCMTCGEEIVRLEGMAIPGAPAQPSGGPAPIGQPMALPADPVPRLDGSASGAAHGAGGWPAGSAQAFPAASAADGPSWVAPAASREASWESVSQPALKEEAFGDVAATEVWQVSVAKNPGHATPFTMELPRDEARDRGLLADDGQLEEPRSFAGAFEGGLMPEPSAKPAEVAVPEGGFGFQEAGLQPGAATVGQRPDDDDEDNSPTIVAQFLGEEGDEDDSPTEVVIKERGVLTRREGAERIEFVPPCIIGRGKASDKRFTGNQTISRRHAKFVKQDGAYLLEDLESTNGTYVNGVELAPGVPAPVPDGAVVRLGTEDFVFSIASA